MKHHLYEKMAHIQWLLHKQQIRGWAARGPLADTSRGQGRILAVLKLRDGISTKDLSYLLGMRISSLNEMLAKLEKNGFVTREPSEHDKRVMLVKLTEQGRNEPQSGPTEYGDIFNVLSDDEQKTLGEYLDKVIDALDANADVDKELIHEKMEDLRERLGDLGEFIEDRGRDFRGWWGMRMGGNGNGVGEDGEDGEDSPESDDFNHGHSHPHEHHHDHGHDHIHEYGHGHIHGHDHDHDHGLDHDHGHDPSDQDSDKESW